MGTCDRGEVTTIRDPARWVIAFQEPLTTPARSQVAFERAAQWASEHPAVACAWLGGLLWQLAGTLPNDDPWQHISARVVLGDGTELRKGVDSDLDTFVGAKLAGVDFGADGHITDIVKPSNPDRSVDAGLAAVSQPLPTASAIVLAFAFESPSKPRMVLEDLAGRHSGSHVFDIAVQSLIWLMWRRRIYIGRDDPYFRVSAFAWFTRAERLAGNERIDIEACRAEIASERIQDGSWTDLNAMFAIHPFFRD